MGAALVVSVVLNPNSNIILTEAPVAATLMLSPEEEFDRERGTKPRGPHVVDSLLASRSACCFELGSSQSSGLLAK